jgi:hypothetical protein
MNAKTATVRYTIEEVPAAIQIDTCIRHLLPVLIATQS